MNQEIEGKLRKILKDNHMIYTSDLDSTIKAIQELVVSTVPEENKETVINIGWNKLRTEILKKWS